MAKQPADTTTLYCSFCGKSQHEVAKLIAGGSAFICDECIDVCNGVLEGRNELAQVGPSDFFEKRLFTRRPKHIFYACPFEEPFDGIYARAVKPEIINAGWSIERGDEIFSTGVVIRQIWEAINVSEVIVADVTRQSPNVMYEIGMAHALRRHVMIVTQDVDDVPFDLRHHRFVKYSADDTGIQHLTHALVKMVESFDAKRPPKKQPATGN